MTFASILKRTGRLLLGVFFWWMMLVLAFELLVTTFTLLRWLFPQADLGGFSPIWIPTAWYDRVLHGLFWFLTAAIGWFYVFRHKYKPLWIVICVWGVLMAANFPFSVASTRLPTDKELIGNFHRHEAGFQRLVEMALEDKELKGASSPRALQKYADKAAPFYPSDAVTEDRKAEYSKLLDQVGVLSFSRSRFGEHTVEMTFPFAHDDKFGRFVLKGYAYSTDDRLPMVSSLDQLPRGAQGVYFRKVTGNWYLFYLFSYQG